MGKRLKLLDEDPWLSPNVKDIEERYERFKTKIQWVEQEFGSLESFATGHQYFGVNFDTLNKRWVYREWAPAASALFLTGDFNGWNPESHPMTKNEFGVWEIFLDAEKYRKSFTHQSKIKVLVKSAKGNQYRIPAYIKRVVQDEDTKNFSGQLWLSEPFKWTDKDFRVAAKSEMLIYECHIGMAQEEERVGTYLEFADNILPRIYEAGYNTIQLMAIQEHPYYGSFGYHVSNFYAPSSRFGTPDELKYLIDKAHNLGIAVILDIVHSHTVKNTIEGINELDGSDSLYFHPGTRGDHPQWDSKLFDYGKTEVLRFLLSNLKYWLEEFHFDGFRFDGVGSMMYYHHGLESIDTREKYFTKGVEWDAITYLQLANSLIHSIKENAVTIAEDVTGMPGLTSLVDDGGLGFDYRLGMGIPDYWIKLLKEKKDEEWNLDELWQILNDRLPHVKTVAYCESHDQALVGDKTIAFRLMDKEMYWHMQIDDDNLVVERGIALHKMIRLFTITLGGQAYMNFMGNEFGHPEWIDFPREGNNWSYKYCRRQWSLADNPNLKYKFLLNFDREMIKLVKQYHILKSSFGNKLNVDEGNKTIAYERNNLIFLFNFHPTHSIADYHFPVHKPGVYRLILNTDDTLFGGHGRIDNSIDYISKNIDGRNQLSVYNTNRTALVFKRIV